MHEDEDIEMLRLAALKTLHRKEAQSEINGRQKSARPIATKTTTSSSTYEYVPAMINSFPDMFASQPIASVNSQPWPMDSNYPSYPPPPQAAAYVPTIAPSTPVNAAVLPNIQLSPRSLAFVAQNNDILMRRQIEKSPTGYRSPAYEGLPERWSPSPEPKHPKYRRSLSRSPPPIKRAPPARRTRSRSPPPRRYSPLVRRSKRSASPKGSNGRYSANTSPNRKRYNRSLSPRKSPRRRRSRSPPPLPPLRRSKSPRSPAGRRDGPRSRRRSPPRERHRNGSINARNEAPRPPRRRSTSPARRKSRSRSPQPRPAAEIKRSPPPAPPKEETKREEKPKESSPQPAPLPVVEEQPKKPEAVEAPREKTEQELEDELLASDNDDGLSLLGDEIDLFASEESESENEGRFKLNSGSSERKPSAPVISFSKLGTTAVKDIPELPSERDRERDYRRERERDRRGRDWRSNRRRDDRRDDRRVESPKFKPTFEAIDEKSSKKSKSPDRTPRISSTVSTVTSGKENVADKRTIQLKRPGQVSKDESKGSTGNSSSSSKSIGELPSSVLKKPIHLRLGAVVKEKSPTTVTTGTDSSASRSRGKKGWRSDKKV